MQIPSMIVFTDLDGTLLDHETYGHEAAAPALAALKNAGIPVALASSKTGPEIFALREEMGLGHCPAIVENGAGVLQAGEAADQIGGRYHELRAALRELPAELRHHFNGFGDMGPEGVAENAGLTLPAASLACTRRFSEPGIWNGTATELEAFLAQLTPHGITARRGGRYLTLSFGGTKADRMGEISACYGAPLTVALGDAPNDIEMIEAADRGIIIANPHSPSLPHLRGEDDGTICRSTKIGPEGWNEMMLRLLSERELN